MAATLHINSLRHAQEKNLRVVAPYLRYYSVFSTMRAVYLTLPEVEWSDGATLAARHSSVIQRVLEHLRSLDPDYSEKIKAEVYRLKADREFISYRAPSNGDGEISENTEEIRLCTLFSEIAQFNSELMQRSLEKHVSPAKFEFKAEYAERIYFADIEGQRLHDEEDTYRLGRYARKQLSPSNLQSMMRQGHVEDFFGAWAADEPDEGGFDPDDELLVIFNIP